MAYKQGFGSLTFQPVDPDKNLDTDPPENVLRIQIRKDLGGEYSLLIQAA